MKVLIVSANSLPASPTGPAYVAGAALRAGHTVEIFECLFAQDVPAELKAHIFRFHPDVVGISIRLVHGYILDPSAIYNTRHLDLRPGLMQVVQAIKEITTAPIILGGPGFNYYGSDWLEYLDLEYGIQGEADFAFPLFLDHLERGADLASVPGMIIRRNGVIQKNKRDSVMNLDETAFPAYELFDLEQYQEHGISPGILTKRGCAFRCTYCPYQSLEGKIHRLKSAGRIVAEIEHIFKLAKPKMVMFCENNFNVPGHHAKSICQEIIEKKMGIRWGSGDLRPMGITTGFCDLMKNSGCDYVNLSIESGSDLMLKRMQRGYSVADVHQSLENLGNAGIPFGASLMIGSLGETPETIHETLELIDQYEIPLGTWVTIGVCLWTPLQKILDEAKKSGQLTEDRMLFAGANYLSPRLSRTYMENLIHTLRAKKGFSVQVNQPFAGYQWSNTVIQKSEIERGIE